MSTAIPEGLTELLEEFAVAVLREKPTDLLQFASQYFTNLVEQRGNSQEVSNQRGGVTKGAGEQMESEAINGSGKEVEMLQDDSDDELPSDSYRSTMNYRRQSVFAESYNPDEEDEMKVVHPKTDDQRKRLVGAVQKIFLFRALDQEQLNEVLDAMFEKKVEIEEKIIEQGEDGDNFYVIDSGVYHCLQSKNGETAKLVFQYNNEGFFGELALMYNTPRAATVIANSPGIIWGLDRKTFKRILCDSASRKRVMYQSLLESVPMLKTLEPYELLNLADALERRYFSDGDCIIKEGDAADAFYIVEEGEVVITRLDSSGKGTLLTTCTSGQYFGELALLTHKPRAASVHAKGEVVCAVLEVGAFERLLGPCKEVMQRNFHHYEEQLMQLFGTTLDISDSR